MGKTKITAAEAAKVFASVGGKAGRGACKRRSKEHYQLAGKLGALKRWKNHQKKP